jgi:hypothetical protein
MKSMCILSPTGILGYGFPEESFWRGMACRPDMIGVDAGSTDPGPYYLGAGVSFTARGAVKRDLELLLEGAVSAGIPLVIGSAGGSGARPHTDWTTAIVMEVARERGYRFDMAVIYADVPREKVAAELAAGRVRSLDGSPELTREAVGAATHIVAQMGVEPIMAALGAGAQVVVATEPTIRLSLRRCPCCGVSIQGWQSTWARSLSAPASPPYQAAQVIA